MFAAASAATGLIARQVPQALRVGSSNLSERQFRCNPWPRNIVMRRTPPGAITRLVRWTRRQWPARPTVQWSWPEPKIPTANHPKFAALRINSIGLTQGVGGTGESMSLIWKSPVGDSGTPADDVRLSVKGAAA
jgi:hypothetical protein